MLVERIKGRWYLCVICHHCRKQFAFQRDTDLAPQTTICLICNECLKSDHYEPKDVQRVRTA